MRFFENCRTEIYIHSAKLRRDKKTGKRLWQLTLINTLIPEEVVKCDATVEAAYAYILTLDNSAVDVKLSAIIERCSMDFFGLADGKKPNLHLDGVDLGAFRLTREAKTAELWFQFELENSPSLHAFVKEYAYTRLWVEFKPAGLFAASEK